MRVAAMSDIIHVLELHLETSEAASIVLDLLDYEFEVDTEEDRCQYCAYSWWNGESYECSIPICRFKSKKLKVED